MKAAYPIVLEKGEKHVVVYVPDFNINTQGVDIPDAMEMARDAICMIGVDMEDDGQTLPTPTEPEHVKHAQEEFVSLVDVDFDEYRRKNELRAVKKNCTIPSWLNYKAEQVGLNFSQVLQRGLMEELGIEQERARQ